MLGKNSIHPWVYISLQVFFLLILAGCAAIGQENPTPTPIPAIAGPEKVIFTVERGSIVSERDFYAEVVPAQQEQLFFRSSGFITRVSVKNGDRVKQGDILAELQVDDLLDQLHQAQIELKASQEAVVNEELQRGYDLQKAESDVNILQIQIKKAELGLQSLTGQQKEEAQAELQILQERLKIAASWLELVKGKNDTSSQGLVESNLLNVERMTRLLAERQIISPCDCIILSSYVKPGMDFEAYATAFILGNPSDLVIRIQYDNEMANSLEPQIEAYMSLTRSKEKLYPVKFIPDFLPVTFKKTGLETQGDDVALNYFYFTTPEDLPADQLPLGGGVTLVVVLGKKDNALLLPPVAIRGNDAFKYVIVQEDDYHRRVEVVNVGLRGDKLWEVIADLEAGDQVLGP